MIRTAGKKGKGGGLKSSGQRNLPFSPPSGRSEERSAGVREEKKGRLDRTGQRFCETYYNSRRKGQASRSGGKGEGKGESCLRLSRWGGRDSRGLPRLSLALPDTRAVWRRQCGIDCAARMEEEKGAHLRAHGSYLHVKKRTSFCQPRLSDPGKKGDLRKEIDEWGKTASQDVI